MEKEGRVSSISFEEIMFTIMSATQDTFKSYLNIDLLAGKVEKKLEPVESDVISIVGVAGERVGYILCASDNDTAQHVAKEMLMCDDPSGDDIRDAFGELANNIAGAFKTKYHEQYGSVALGLPLVVSGKLRPLTEPPQPEADVRTVNVQCKGVTIPFKNVEGSISFCVMVYM